MLSEELLNRLSIKLKTNISEEEKYPFLKELFSLQREVFFDKHCFKALLWGRRASKTYVVAVKLLYVAMSQPNSTSLFCALTNQNSYEILWSLLKTLVYKYSLPVEFNETKHNLYFSNGSEIRVRGCSNGIQADRFRGCHYEFVCVDEAGEFGFHLEYLLDQALSMALEEVENVEVWLCGTPGKECVGYFYDATTNPDSKFKTWHSTVLQNEMFPRWVDKRTGKPFLDWKERAQKWLVGYLKKNGWSEDDNHVKREVFAIHVKDTESIVIDIDEQRNIYTSFLPENVDIKYGLGIDLGFNDAFALSLGAFTFDPQYSSLLYIVDIFSQSRQLIDDDVRVIFEYIEKYSPIWAVCDTGGSGGRKFLESFNAKYGTFLSLEAAQKRDKSRYCDLLSNDSKQGRILFAPHLRKNLQQMKQLVWKDKTKGEIKTSSTVEDNEYDSCLYLWRKWMPHSRVREPEKKPELNLTQQYLQEYDKKQRQIEKYRRRAGLY